MLVRCPNCSHAIEVVDDREFDEMSCPSCGSRWSLSGADEQTATLTMADQIPALKHFKLIEMRGMGQFGRVWRAIDTQLEREVAIKLPHVERQTPAEAAFFLHEARSAAQLSHENIVRVLEVGREQDRVYIVSEYIDGLTLRQWIRTHAPDYQESARVISIIGRALQHAHDQGIIHRDLKPANILIDGRQQPHVTDFGLARREGHDATIAASGQIVGTPAYMSPEQAGYGNTVDHRTDVYALGVILYEMLTGQRPFRGGSRVLMHQIMHDEPRSLRSLDKRIPKDLEVICLKAMAKRVDERYLSAGEVADDLARFLDGEPIKARRTPSLVRAFRWTRRHPAAAALTLLVAAVAVLLPLALRDRQPEISPTSRMITLATEPPGATVVLVPMDDRSGVPQFDRKIEAGVSPIETRCEPGFYLVVAYKNDHFFHEVLRHVPARHEKLAGIYPHLAFTLDGTVAQLPPVKLFDSKSSADRTVGVKGGSFLMSSTDLTTEITRVVPDFLLDRTEVTVEQYRDAVGALPHNLARTDPPGDEALSAVTWDEAVAYAERVGQRLVLDDEFQYVATKAGNEMIGAAWRRGEAPVPGPVLSDAFDRLEWPALDEPIVGMRSNVVEWTANWWAGQSTALQNRVVRGGYVLVEPGPDAEPINYSRPAARMIYYAPLSTPQLGFRCARSKRPTINADRYVH